MDASRIDDELRVRAKAGWTGGITVGDSAGRELADLYFFEGDLYSVQVSGFQPHLFARLLAAGIIDEERRRTCDASMAPDSRDELIGRFSVEQGWLPVERLAEFHSEYLLASLGAVREAGGAVIAEEAGAATNVRCALPSPVADVIASVDMRAERSRSVWAGVGAGAGPAETVLAWRGARGVAPFAAPELAAFAAEVDGARSVDELADACGFTRAEAEFLTAALVNDGLVEVADVTALPAIRCLVPEDAARASLNGVPGSVGP